MEASAPIEGVLDDAERESVELRFGVSTEQVVRDHVISHALAAIATVDTDDLVFFGGTALSRTHLTDVRLSEDIDLITSRPRGEMGDRIEAAISRRLGRTIGAVTFTPHIRETNHAEPSVMEVNGVRVQIQLLSSEGYPAWPTEVLDIEQRYADAPRARLRVLTSAAFAASKLAAWAGRQAPRDLYDLWALARGGKLDRAAVDIFARLGPYTSVTSVSFAQLPADAEWDAALGHQCIPAVGPNEAAQVIRGVLDRLA